VWGNNNPVGWGFPIVNFVFWVGIGHAGHADLGDPVPVEAELADQHQPLRRGDDDLRRHVRRHLPGHPRRAGLVGVLAVPDPQPDGDVAQLPQPAAVGRVRGQHVRDGLAAVLVHGHDPRPRDASATGRKTKIEADRSTASSPLGWRGSSRHWHRYERAYLLLAALATPLVLSVHSVCQFDFAVSQLPGWHTTIFPPYFVAGAIFGGFAMVLTLAIPARSCSGSRTSSRCGTSRT
jgi:hypothetical protein